MTVRFARVQVPLAVVADTKVTPAGRVSVTTTSVASAVPPAPRFRTWIVYARSVFSTTGSGLSDLVS